MEERSEAESLGHGVELFTMHPDLYVYTSISTCHTE